MLKNVEQEPAKKRSTVAIGYNYEDDNTANPPLIRVEEPKKDITSLNADEENDEDSESDIDLGTETFDIWKKNYWISHSNFVHIADLTVDVSKIETQQANELNTCAHAYGMITNDFFSFLNNDLEEAENLRMAREQEEEKAMFSVHINFYNYAANEIYKWKMCFFFLREENREKNVELFENGR